MKEFLFKAKAMFNGIPNSSKWIESHNVKGGFSGSIFVGGVQCYFKSFGMYTGLPAINEKIFEGDILEWLSTEELKTKVRGVVKYEIYKKIWQVKNDDLNICVRLCDVYNHSIVIGNCFDNSELLEE